MRMSAPWCLPVGAALGTPRPDRAAWPENDNVAAALRTGGQRLHIARGIRSVLAGAAHFSPASIHGVEGQAGSIQVARR